MLSIIWVILHNQNDYYGKKNRVREWVEILHTS
jgi:hypothetical protein